MWFWMKSCVNRCKNIVSKITRTIKTIEPFVMPVVAAVKFVSGDKEGAKEALKQSLDRLNDIPVIGQIKGMVHFALGDTKGAIDAIKASNERTGECLGGFLGGPAGAYFGSIAGGALTNGLVAFCTGDKKVAAEAKQEAIGEILRGSCVVAGGIIGHTVDNPGVGGVAGGVMADGCNTLYTGRTHGYFNDLKEILHGDIKSLTGLSKSLGGLTRTIGRCTGDYQTSLKITEQLFKTKDNDADKESNLAKEKSEEPTTERKISTEVSPNQKPNDLLPDPCLKSSDKVSLESGSSSIMTMPDDVSQVHSPDPPQMHSDRPIASRSQTSDRVSSVSDNLRSFACKRYPDCVFCNPKKKPENYYYLWKNGIVPFP